MGRFENAVRNIFFGTLGNIISILLGFVSRTVLIKTIGITYLGVNGLYTNVLSVLSLAELGIGTAFSYSLYKPVVDKDYEKIQLLMNLYKKMYRLIALIITIFGLVLVPFLHYIITNPGDISYNELNLFYFIFLFNTVTSYFVSYKYSLSNAEQKNYIQINIQVITSIFILIVQIFVLIFTRSYLMFLLTSSVISFIQKIFVYFYFKHLYPYLMKKNDSSLTLEEKNFFNKNVIALLFHKIGDTSINQTDNIIISSFINITSVAILSNYNLIITNVYVFLNTVFYSVVSSIGNLIATENKEKQYLLFKVYRFLGFCIYGLSSLVFVFLLTPFITLWIGNDMTMSQSIIILIMIDYYFKGHRTVLNNFKSAAGIFDADKYISILQAIINLVISIVLVAIIGLPGVFIGTIVAGLVSNVVKPFIVFKMIFNRDAKYYFMDSIVYIVVILITYFVLNPINHIILLDITILNFVFMLVMVIVVSCIIFYIFFRQKEEYHYLQSVMNIKYGVRVKSLYYKIYLLFSNTSHKMKYFILNRLNIKRKVDVSIIEEQNKMNDQNSMTNKILLNDLLNYTRYQLTSIPVKSVKQYINSFLSETIYSGKDKKMDEFFLFNGLLTQSLEWSHLINNDVNDLTILQEYYDEWVKKSNTIQNLDYVMNGYSLIYVEQLITDDKYSQSIENIKNYVFEYPRDSSGSLPYKIDNLDNIYVDSIGMICPFLSRYGETFKVQEATDLAIKQIMNFNSFGFDSNTQLPYRGYNLKENTKYGIIGWGRSVGWLLMGMVDSLAYIPNTNPYYNSLANQFCMIVKAAVKYQMNNGYYKWQLTALDGPIDTSATAMISYAIKRGVVLGLLSRSYLNYSNLGLFAIFNSVENGMVKDSSAESKGFGLYPQNYGIYPWGQGPSTSLAVLSFNDTQPEPKPNKRRKRRFPF